LGLYLFLEVRSAGTLQTRGILFAVMAAVGMALFVTVSSITIRNADPQTVNLYTLSGGSLLFIIFLFLVEGTAGSITAPEFFTLCGSGVALFFALVSFYIGLKIIGPVKASMLLNIEPIFTIALATVMLDEHLSGGQFLGAGLVILGIVMVNYQQNRNGK
jgi:drug/metabolite transporter (DMT)-like permease